MLGKINRIIFKFHMVNEDTSMLKNISMMPFFQSFKEGINCNQKGSFKQANMHFNNSLKKIKESSDYAWQHYIHVLKKIASNNIKLGLMKQTEDNLYDIIKEQKIAGVHKIVLYENYIQLFNHMITYDLQKAIILAKTLLSQKHRQHLPMKNVKALIFSLGNAYLLNGNCIDAKKRYSQCLKLQPDPQLQAHTLHNLAMACWWHKNPPPCTIKPDKQPHQWLQKQFKQTPQIFKKALKVLQNPQALSDKQSQVILESVLQEQHLYPGTYLKHPCSGKICYNLAQFYLENDPLLKTNILFWLQQSLTVLKQEENSLESYQIYAKLCLLNNQISILEKTLPQVIMKFKSNSEVFYLLRVMALILRDKDVNQAQKYAKQAQQLYKNSNNYKFYWYNAMKHLFIDEIKLFNENQKIN